MESNFSFSFQMSSPPAPEYMEYFEVDVSADPDNLNSDTESEDIDEENNNVDNEDDEDDVDEDFDDNADTIPFPQDDEDENDSFPQGIESEEIVVDNDDNGRLDESHEDDVEIVGEDIGLEVVAETAVVPDTEDDTDVEEIEYPLPVINSATTEEVLGISSDGDATRSVVTTEESQNNPEAENNREGSPQPGPSRGPGQSVVKSVVSRGKRLPWVDNDDNDTSDSEGEGEDVIRNINLSLRPSPVSEGAVRVSESVITSAPAAGGANTSIRSDRSSGAGDTRRDFDRRRFWRQLSTTTEDLDSIEPRVYSTSGPVVGAMGDIRVRPATSLLFSPPIPSPRPSSLTTSTSNTTIWRVQPSSRDRTGVVSAPSRPSLPRPPSPHPPLTPPSNSRPPSPPADSPPSSPVISRRRTFTTDLSPPPQSSMYSPLQLAANIPRISTPRFEPVEVRRSAGLSSPPRIQSVRAISFDLPTPSLSSVRGSLVAGGSGGSSVRPGQQQPGSPAVRASQASQSSRAARIDRILELSRRSERERGEEAQPDLHRVRLLNEIALEREHNNRIDRTLAAGRRSLERAQTLISRERDRAQESVVNEFVRDSPTPTSLATTEEGPAAKRARLDSSGGGSGQSGQYEADIAEALKRSLLDQQGGSQTEPGPAQPQPGCSHWDNSANTSGSPSGVSTPTVAPPGPGLSSSPPPPAAVAEPAPDYEGLYKELLTSNKKLVTELQSSLECPVCLETIREAPVQCCRNGHLICKVCIVRTQICPTCRAPLGVGLSQKCVSHVANRLIDLLPHPCTNKDRGCTEELLLTLLTRHESECRFRDVRCPVGYCLHTVPMASLSSHISSSPHSLTTHSYTSPLTFTRGIPAVTDSNGIAVFQGLKSFDPIRFTFAGQNFYLQTIASQDRRLLYHFVQLEGNKEDCSKFWVKITVSSVGSFTPSHASQTVRPAPLDQHCRDDLQAIGFTLVMTER